MLFSWAIVAAMLAITVDKRLWPSSVVFMVGFFVASARPEWVHYVMSVTNLALTLNAVYVWKPAEGWMVKRPAG